MLHDGWLQATFDAARVGGWFPKYCKCYFACLACNLLGSMTVQSRESAMGVREYPRNKYVDSFDSASSDMEEDKFTVRAAGEESKAKLKNTVPK